MSVRKLCLLNVRYHLLVPDLWASDWVVNNALRRDKIFLQVKTSEKAMRNKLLPPTTLPALLAIADCIIEGEEEAPGVKAESSSPTFDGEAAAEMAAGWCRTFAAVPRFGSTAEYGLSGLAAAVILSATPK